MYIFPPPIETNLCNYSVTNFSNIVNQSTLSERGNTSCKYFPLLIEPKLCTYTLPNFSNILYQSTQPQLDTTLCTYFHLPLNKIG